MRPRLNLNLHNANIQGRTYSVGHQQQSWHWQENQYPLAPSTQSFHRKSSQTAGGLSGLFISPLGSILLALQGSPLLTHSGSELSSPSSKPASSGTTIIFCGIYTGPSHQLFQTTIFYARRNCIADVFVGIL